MSDTESALRQHVVNLLLGRGAHVDFDRAVDGIPQEVRGRRPRSLPYSPWELIEHMRIAQWDILEFSRNPDHVSPEWPSGYWPEGREPPTKKAWSRSIEHFRSDLESMQAIVMDSDRDLLEPFPYGDGQTLLREALLLADHNAYHVGQLVLARRLLRIWA